MKTEDAERVIELIKEIKELSKINVLFRGEYSRLAHFVILQHYGNCKPYETIEIDARHTQRLLSVVNEIIEELENELSEI